MMHLPAFLVRLNLDTAADERSVRRAYARELKLIDQEKDATGFQALREAYEAALVWVRYERDFIEAQGTVTEIETAALPVHDDANPADGTAQALNVSWSGTAHRSTAPAPDARVVAAEKIPVDTVTPSAFTAAIETFSENYRALIGVSDISAWRHMLETCLADARLDSLMDRQAFERHIAALLAEGWRAGHETLLVAAVKVFGWERDRRRVQTLDPVGWMLDRALDEWGTFLTQSLPECAAQRTLIARLRDPRPPTHRELVKHMGRIDGLEQCYPHWLPLITDQSAIVRWRALYKEVPAWRHKLHFRSVSEADIERSRGQERSSNVPALIWAWVAFVIVFQVAKCVQSSDKPATGPWKPLPTVLRAPQ